MYIINSSKEFYAFHPNITDVSFKKGRRTKQICISFGDSGEGTVLVQSQQEAAFISTELVKAIREGRDQVSIDTSGIDYWSI